MARMKQIKRQKVVDGINQSVKISKTGKNIEIYSENGHHYWENSYIFVNKELFDKAVLDYVLELAGVRDVK